MCTKELNSFTMAQVKGSHIQGRLSQNPDDGGTSDILSQNLAVLLTSEAG